MYSAVFQKENQNVFTCDSFFALEFVKDVWRARIFCATLFVSTTEMDSAEMAEEGMGSAEIGWAKDPKAIACHFHLFLHRQNQKDTHIWDRLEL